jgi:hypothetical protein
MRTHRDPPLHHRAEAADYQQISDRRVGRLISEGELTGGTGSFLTSFPASDFETIGDRDDGLQP